MLNNTQKLSSGAITGPSNATLDSVVKYDAVRLNPTSTIYKDPSSSNSEPRTLRISHEIGADGMVNSAIIMDDVHDLPNSTTADSKTARVLFKLTYHPDYVTKEQLQGQIARMCVYLVAALGASRGLDVTQGINCINQGDNNVILGSDACEGPDFGRILNLEH